LKEAGVSDAICLTVQHGTAVLAIIIPVFIAASIGMMVGITVTHRVRDKAERARAAESGIYNRDRL
jgi:hypothetical protein